MGAMGAAKGFAGSTNIAKAAAMTKDGSSFAEALNQKFDKRFGEMQDAAKRGMSQKDYDATKKRAEQNGFDIEQQRARDAIIHDMKVGNITPQMAQNQLAANGLLREDEQSHAMDMAEHMVANTPVTPKQPEQGENMAQAHKMQHMDAQGMYHATQKSANEQAGVQSFADGTTAKAGEWLRTHDDTKAFGGEKHFPDGTKMSADGTMQFANGAVMKQGLKDANGNTLPQGAIQHGDGIYTVGNRIITANGVSQDMTQPIKLPDGSIVRPNGDREIHGGANAGGTTIDKNGVVTHENGAVSKGMVTKHTNGSQSFSDGSVLQKDGNMLHMHGETTNADGMTTTPQGDKVFSDGSVLHHNGDITAKGATKHQDGSTTYPNRVEHGNGSVTYNDGHVLYADGTTVDGKGNISFDNGKSYQAIKDMPNGRYVHPSTGDIAYADGSVSHVASGAVSNADGYTGRVNHADGRNGTEGTFSLGGSVYWANGTTANADGSIEFDTHNSGIVVKGQTVLHQTGTKTTTQDGTTQIKRTDGYTTFGQAQTQHRTGTKFRGFGIRSHRK